MLRRLVRAFSTKKNLKVDSNIPSDSFVKQLAAIPQERYRNFAIAAHIDHGKSTLSDRLLEITGVIDKQSSKSQILDKLDVERERGITVKAQTCSMIYNYKGQDYLLNLVDTPGHVDFRHEVARSYAACSGALLLVDATQGVQAQTVANFTLAQDVGLEIVPVINKIDLPHADVERVEEQLLDIFLLGDPIAISAKSGKNVEKVLPAIVERIPPPHGRIQDDFRLLLVDSWFDNFLGVVMLVHIVDGTLTKGTRVVSAHTGKVYDVREVGIMYPERVILPQLRAGQMGYIITGMKKSQEAHIGDTFLPVNSNKSRALPGFAEAKPMVFLGAFPGEGASFEKMEENMEQLTLNDRSVTVQRESSNALGQGWRLGFLGTLHASVFQERLQREHGGRLIFTAPTVPYKIIDTNYTTKIITNPDDFPQVTTGPFGVKDLQEPFVNAIIHCPPEYMGAVIQLAIANRGQQTDVEYLANGQVRLNFLLPLAELVEDFFGKLKGITRGYAALDYEDAGYQSSNIVKLELLVNGQGVDALARVMHSSQVQQKGREWVQKFRQYLRYQLFEVIIQARCGSRIVARETIKAKRKDVLARLHASDISRRKKLLAKQKEGKRNLQATGRVFIPQEAYQGFLSKS